MKSNRILFLSFFAFAICFAVWMVNGVLVTFLTNNGVFKWSSEQTGWLFGVPVLVGSVLRLPVGVLTDKYGGKWVMGIILLLSAIPMFLLSYANSYWSFLLLSFGFGIAGSSFAAGVAYISLWFPKERQGTAMGIFGAGNMGAALTTLFAPYLLNRFTDGRTDLEGWRSLPQLYAGVLVLTAIIFLLFTENKKPASIKSFSQRLAPLTQSRVWQFGLYYFFVFGSFVALTQWLIPYYVNVYGMTIIAAGMMTTMFNLPSGIIRALGGFLSDRLGARKIMQWVFGVSLIGLFFLFPPRVEIQTPGQGILASENGRIEKITDNEIVVVSGDELSEETVYQLLTKEDHITIRFGIHNADESFLPLPSTSVWHEPQIKEGETVEKGQMLAKGVTQIYFQANKWIFTGIVFLIGMMMGIGGAAVFKFISDSYPQDVGTVGGVVGVIGGLGGFSGPIIFGYLLKVSGVWTTCWMFLFLVALISVIWMQTSGKRENEKEMRIGK